MNSKSFAADLYLGIDGKVLASEIASKAIPYNEVVITPFHNTEDRCFFTSMIQCRINPPKYDSMFDLF